MDKSLSKASHIEKANRVSIARPSADSKSSQCSSSPSRPRFAQSLRPVVSEQLFDVQRPAASLVPAPSGAIRAESKPKPGSAISQPEKEEASHIDDSADRGLDSQQGASANGDASETSSSHADVEAYHLPDSKEGLSLNTLRSSVKKRSSLLSYRMQQMCEDGIAFYEHILSLKPPSLEGAEILNGKWKELQPATDFYVNTLLKTEDDRRKLAVGQDMLDHPEKHKQARILPDEHTQSEPMAEAKTSMTAPLISEAEFTADEVEARRELQNELQNVRIWIEELYVESFTLTRGLEGTELAELNLDNKQKERISEIKSMIKGYEMQRQLLEVDLYQVTREMAAVRVAA